MFNGSLGSLKSLFSFFSLVEIDSKLLSRSMAESLSHIQVNGNLSLSLKGSAEEKIKVIKPNSIR